MAFRISCEATGLGDDKHSHRKSDQAQGLINARYEIIAFVGKGSMGAVYQAYDHLLQRRVALKCLLSQAATDKRRLALREAQTLATINHPNVMQIFDIVTVEGQVWLVTEWLEGQPLTALVQPFSPLTLLAVLVQVFEGLHAAHDAQIFHRDIKPANVMMTPKGRVVLLDFGVAFAPGFSSGETVVGSLRYCDPRNLAGKRPDVASDMFSTALMALELSLGRQVVPDLAPLPLYEYFTQLFNGDVAACLEEVFPPLAEVLATILLRSTSDEVVDLCAQRAAEKVQHALRLLSDQSPRQTLSRAMQSVQTTGFGHLQAFSFCDKILARDDLPSQDKIRWFSYQTFVEQHLADAKDEECDFAPAKIGVANSKRQTSARLAVAEKKNKWLCWLLQSFQLAVSVVKMLRGRLQARLKPVLERRLRVGYYSTAIMLAAVLLIFSGIAILATWSGSIDEKTSASRDLTGVGDIAQNTNFPLITRLTTVAMLDQLNEGPSELLSLIERPEVESVAAENDGDAVTENNRLSLEQVQVYIAANAWADVKIDGALQGRIPSAQPFVLEPGNYEIVFSSPLVETMTATITVNDDVEEQRFRFQLLPRETTRRVVWKNGGRVFIGGKNYGEIGDREIVIPYGNHEVWIEDQGAIVALEKITVAPESPYTINLQRKEEDVVRSE